MAELEKMGEFVRSASSTIEAPVVRRLKEQFAGDSAKPGRQGQRAAAPAARRDQGGDGQRGDRGPGQVPGDGVNGGAPSAPASQVAPIAADRGSVADTSSDAPAAAGTRPAPRPVPPRPVPSVPDVGTPAGSPGAGRPEARPAGPGQPGQGPAGPAGGGQGPRPAAPRPGAQRPGGPQTSGGSARPGGPSAPGTAPRPGAPRPGAPAGPGQRGPRPGPRPGNNPFSSTATGMGATPAPRPGLGDRDRDGDRRDRDGDRRDDRRDGDRRDRGPRPGVPGGRRRLAGPGPAAAVPARTPTVARVLAARVPVVRVLAR